MSLASTDLDKELCRKVAEVFDLDPNNDTLIYVDVNAALEGRLVYKQDFLKKYNGGKLDIGVQPRLDYGMDLGAEINKIKSKEKPIEIKVEGKKSFLDWLSSFIYR